MIAHRRTVSAYVCGGLLTLAMSAARPAGLTPQVVKYGSTINVNFNVAAAAPAETCYSVIVDFSHLARFIPSLDSSEIVSERAAPLKVRQVGHARAGFFTYTLDVTLAIELDPPRQIRFSRVAGNVRRMQGSWLITGDGSACRIGYAAELEPDFWIPPVIGPRLIRAQVQEQIEALVTEINRRREPL